MMKRTPILFCLAAAVILTHPNVYGFQAAQQSRLDRLRSNVEQIIRSVNANWGIYIKCVETGEEIAINADAAMDTMSVIKIPLMVEVFRQIEEGKFSLSDRIPMKEPDKRPGTGVMRSLDAGASLTVKDLITLMIIVSDNTATDMLFEKVGGLEPVNKLMQSYGLNTIKATGTTDAWFKALSAVGDRTKFHMDGKTPFGLSSPRDMGKLLEKIFKGEAVSKKASEQMIQIMRGQVYSTRLPKYVNGFRLPHKTGDFLPYIGNDVGIMESRDRNIIICVFNSRHTGVRSYLEDAIGRVAEQVADYYLYRQ